MARTAPYKGKREKVEHPIKLFGRMMGLIFKKHIILTAFLVVFMLISAVSGTLASYLIKDLINTASDMNKVSSTDYSHFYLVLEEMAGLYVIGIAFTFAFQLILVRLTQKTLDKTRTNLFEHMENLPISYFDGQTTGEVMSVYTNDTDTLRQMISQAIPQAIICVAQIIGNVAVMMVLSWQLTMISIASIFVMFFVIKVISGKSSKYFILQQGDLSKINGYIEEMTKGQKVVKVFNHEKPAEEGFSLINSKLEKSNFRANMYSAVLFPIVGNIGYLTYATTAMVGAALIISYPGIFTIGAIASFLLISKNFAEPFNQIANQISFIVQGLAGTKRIFSMMDAPKEVDEGYVTLVNVNIGQDGSMSETPEVTHHWAWKNPHHPDGQNLTLLQGDIRMFDVDFGYAPDKIVLHDISIYAKPGQKIAFVGATGAGKTTITNLINRFYDIADGKIRYDGINITKIRKKDLRHSLAIVLQDTHLFTGTIKDNIRYGKKDASDEEVISAAKLANADGFISNLPEGYDTVITGDGGNLSQGQRQLISIARAAVMNPPVLILDEATSSIDTYTESLIKAGMDKLMENRTTFAIAHRLSTVQNSNAIMVLDHGRIIERGDHKSLIALHGVYYQLYMGAFELE